MIGMPKNIIKGGLADKSKPSEFSKRQLRMGMKVEMEHTKSKQMAKEIAMDHLKEHPNYYTALKKMEADLEKKGYSLEQFAEVLPKFLADNRYMKMANSFAGEYELDPYANQQSYQLPSTEEREPDSFNSQSNPFNPVPNSPGGYEKQAGAIDHIMAKLIAKSVPSGYRNAETAKQRERKLLRKYAAEKNANAVDHLLGKIVDSFKNKFKGVVTMGQMGEKEALEYYKMEFGKDWKKQIQAELQTEYYKGDKKYRNWGNMSGYNDATKNMLRKKYNTYSEKELSKYLKNPFHGEDEGFTFLNKQAAFKSKAQRRKFYALKAEGKMDQKTIDEWEADTPDKIPEKLEKKAATRFAKYMKTMDMDELKALYGRLKGIPFGHFDDVTRSASPKRLSVMKDWVEDAAGIPSRRDTPIYPRVATPELKQLLWMNDQKLNMAAQVNRAAKKLLEKRSSFIGLGSNLAKTAGVMDKFDEIAESILKLRKGTPEYMTASAFIRNLKKSIKKTGKNSPQTKQITSKATENVPQKMVKLQTLGLSKVSFEKKAGGPGSGVEGINTKKIGLPLTPHITIMKRKEFMEDNRPFIKDKNIKMSEIKYVGQEKYVPKKLKKFMDVSDEDWIDYPIDVTINKDGEYAVLDGHHRYMRANKLNKKNIKANVYKLKEADVGYETLHKAASYQPSFIGMEKTALAPSSFAGLGKSIKGFFGKGVDAFRPGNIGQTAKDAGKLMMGGAFGSRTHMGKFDPFFGVKALGRGKERYTSGPTKGMYRYTDEGDSLVDFSKKRNWGQYLKDEFAGGSPTRGDLMAKQMAKTKAGDTGMKRWFMGKGNVGEYLKGASPASLKKMEEVNKMGMADFIKKYPKLAANYYGRNIAQKGLTVGFPLMSFNAMRTGENRFEDPSASATGANLGSLAEGVGWGLTGPLGIAGSIGSVAAMKAGGKALGNLIERPEAPIDIKPELPLRQHAELVESIAPSMVQSPYRYY